MSPEKSGSPNWGDGFELAARNSIALLRGPDDSGHRTVADIGLRLATPALLGATTLAVAADLPLSRAYPISPILALTCADDTAYVR